MTDRPTILFDGLCNLCNASVNYVLDHDPEARFRFGSLQSPEAGRILDQFDLPDDYLDSLVLVEADDVYTGSSAALRIARRLSGPARLLWPLIIVPTPVRDLVYRWVARNRYRWFGQRDSCRMPTPELKSRFI